jgi:MYXO-CTERM domain-containing protein
MLLMVGICPISERFCALDNFPRGGQDSELTLLLLVALMALVLLLALRRRSNLNDAFALWRALFTVQLNLLFRRSLCVRKEPTAWATVKKRPDILLAFPLPLRI